MEQRVGLRERGEDLKTTVAELSVLHVVSVLSVYHKAFKIIPLLSLQIQNGGQKIVSHIHYSVKGNANGLISIVIAEFSTRTLAYNSLMHIGQRMGLQNRQFKKWLVI